MASFKVENDEVWAAIKEKKVTGFSIEAWLGLMPVDFSAIPNVDEMTDDDFDMLYSKLEKLFKQK